MKPALNGPVGRLPPHNDTPPLEPGDRPTRDEFERRCNAVPHLKAELVAEYVHMLRGDLASVIACLQSGIASPGHARFLNRLPPAPCPLNPEP